jgi:hypothetical protein
VTDAVPVRARLLPVVLIAVAVGAVAYGIRVAILLHTDGWLGSSAYDDGVYYAAGASFAHGRWPYADFLFLQPPGIVAALAPFTALGRVIGDPAAVTVARLVWIGVGAANCALVAVVAGRRSWRAALIAGGFAACFFPLAYGERSTLLEPLGTLLLLVALLVSEGRGGRAAIVAGAIAGAAVDVKIWYVVPVLVLVAFSRHRLRFLLGAVGGGLLIAAPFLLRDPGALIKQVFLDQLGRPRLSTDTFAGRAVVLTGSRYTQGAADPVPKELLAVTAAIVLLALVAAVLALRVRLGRIAVVQAVLTTGILLISPSFFTHYVTYPAPWIALLLGIGAETALGRIRRRLPAAALAIVVTALLTAPTLQRDLLPPRAVPDLTAISAAASEVQGCVRTDDPGRLAAIGVLTRTLDEGCELWPDVTGWTFDKPGFPAASNDRPASARWQRFVMPYLLGGAAVIVDRRGTGLSAASKRTIARLPVLARSDGPVLHAVP